MRTRAPISIVRRALGADRPGPWQVGLLICVWLVSRELLSVSANNAPQQDVALYYEWVGSMLAHHHLPTDGPWQYPPGAALVLLVVHLFGASGYIGYRGTFINAMLLCDLGITAALASIGLRERRLLGAWAWVLGVAMIGPLVLLRFDMAPTLVVVLGIALSWSGERQRLYGALIGVGAAIKVWPLVGLMTSSTSTGKRGTATLFSVISLAAILIGSALFLGDPFTFLSHESSRGLGTASVAATPWFLVQLLGGPQAGYANVNQSWDLLSGSSHTVASGLHILMIPLAAYFGVWWLSHARRERAPRPALLRDSAFTALLWFVVVSPILSPQYMVWLVGLAAVAISSRETLMRRPAALTLLAALATGMNGVQGVVSDSWIVWDTIRNGLLLAAAFDAVRRLGLPLLSRALTQRRSDPERWKLRPDRGQG